MKKDKIDFYREVLVLPSYINKKYSAKKGVVLGASEEGDIIYGYAVFIFEENEVVFIEKDYLSETGVKFRKEDFY